MKDISLEVLIKDAKELIRLADNISERITIKDNDFRGVIICALFSGIVSGYESICILCKNLYSIEAEKLLRSLLETLFYMGACYKSDDAYNRYIGKNITELKKTCNIVEAKPHIYSEVIQEGIKNLYNEALKEADSKKTKPLTAEEAAKFCLIEGIYEFAYRELSKPVHSSPGYVFRHYIKHDSSEVKGINIGPNDSRVNDVLFTANAALLISLDWFAELNYLERKSDIERIASKYKVQAVTNKKSE